MTALTLSVSYFYFFCFPLARLREPQDGLFTGQIDAVDTVNYSYRVTFDRPGLVCSNIVLLFVTVCSFFG